MIERRRLIPGKTYLVTKEILSNNEMFPGNRRKWTIETGRETIGRFLLPIGHILSFTMVQNMFLIVIRIHNEQIIKKVPRMVKHQAYRLEAPKLDQYTEGQLEDIALPNSPTYEHEDLCKAVRKRFGNGFQSFSIRYNRQFNRKDRLSARPTGIYEVQGEEDLKQLLLEIQNTPLVHGDKSDLEHCATNSYRLDRKDVQKLISWQRVIDLVRGGMNAFKKEVKIVREKLLKLMEEFRYLQEIPPGWYFGRQ
jgi:hypothetical protein